VPLPTDSSVHLVNVPEHTVAVIRSSGAMSAEKNEKNTHQLAGWLKKMGRFIISGQPYVAHQNLFPVFEFLRRTEIHIPLEIEK